MAKSLSTANSALSIQIPGLYPVPQKIEGYATDDSFMAEDVTTGETVIGVDGKLSAGFIPYKTPFVINLQADSESCVIFDNWMAAQKSEKDMLSCNAVVLLQGNGDKYALTRGFLVQGSPMAGSKKILQPRKFTIEFESVSKAPA